ncbi:MAG: flagellar basal-body MS-ring/collar protein FliF [Syntrophales bacterium]
MDPIQFLSNFWRTFSELAPIRKMSLLLVALLTLGGIWLMVNFSNRTDYRVLFANLSAEDAGSIVDKLKEKKVLYELNGAGDTISVPADKVAELRLELATTGLPRGGGIGFEIFDQKMKFGATEFEQQLNYRRALQGELARTIGSMEEVQQVRVHIALPKESLFVEEQRKPTASVTMKLKSGRALRPSQIDGIAHLVASSIEGLSPENVMVIDSRGNILSKPSGDPKFMRVTASQMEYQQNLEKDLASRIQTMLENVVGSGKAVVRVAADLDFRVTEKTEETYDSEAPVIRSMQRQTEKATARDTGKGGSTVVGGSGAPEREKVDEVINYEINKVVNKTVMPVGDVQKLSIAVLVDGIYQKDKQGKEIYQPRDKKEIENLEDLVRKSVGFNASRGDQVAISNMPFKKLPDEEMVDSSPWWEKLLVFAPLVKYLVTIAILIMVLLFIVRPMIRGLISAIGQQGSAPRRRLEHRDDPEDRAERPALAMPEMEPKMLTDEDTARQLAMADSKKFAELLRNWIK